MNLRVIIVAVYMIMFVVTMLNMATLQSTMFAEVAPILFTSIIMALVGVLLSLWVYQDGKNIKVLDTELVKLKNTLKELEKKE